MAGGFGVPIMVVRRQTKLMMWTWIKMVTSTLQVLPLGHTILALQGLINLHIIVLIVWVGTGS